MHYYRLTLAYQGTHYFGWQIQNQERTIQGELEAALKKICKSDEVASVGSGRTDAGVHALAQVVRVFIPLKIEAPALLRALNSHLPQDIRVIESAICDDTFHPIHSAKSKEYLYLFHQTKIESPFAHNLITNITFDLDFDLMKKAMDAFVGRHDFVNFFTVGTDIKSTIREIYSMELTEIKDLPFNGAWIPTSYALKVHGNGFLKQMVRLMMGTIWEAGRKKISVFDIEDHLKNGPKAKKLAAVAPPQGLYLKQVFY